MAPQRLADRTAALRLPLPHHSVIPGARDPAAIGAVGRRHHLSLVAPQRLADRTAALHLPLPHRSIIPGAHDPAAIGAVGRRPHQSLVAPQRLADRTAALHLPLPHRSILSSAHDPAAIGAVGRREHQSLVAPQPQLFAAVSRAIEQRLAGGSWKRGSCGLKLPVAAKAGSRQGFNQGIRGPVGGGELGGGRQCLAALPLGPHQLAPCQQQRHRYHRQAAGQAAEQQAAIAPLQPQALLLRLAAGIGEGQLAGGEVCLVLVTKLIQHVEIRRPPQAPLGLASCFP